MSKPILVFGWLEEDGRSSALGGMNDALRNPDGSFLSFPDAGAAMAFLTKKMPTTINIAQIFDAATGKFDEYERTEWKARRPKQPTAVIPPTPPALPPKT